MEPGCRFRIRRISSIRLGVRNRLRASGLVKKSLWPFGFPFLPADTALTASAVSCSVSSKSRIPIFNFLTFIVFSPYRRNVGFKIRNQTVDSSVRVRTFFSGNMAVVSFRPMIVVSHQPVSFRRNQRQGIIDSFRAGLAPWHLPNLDDHSPSFLVQYLIVLKQNRPLFARHYGHRCHNSGTPSSEHSYRNDLALVLFTEMKYGGLRQKFQNYRPG